MRTDRQKQSGHAMAINPLSGVILSKMEIFRGAAGDFGRIRPSIREIRSVETVHRIAKARQWWAFQSLSRPVCPAPGPLGWGARIRTFKMASWKGSVLRGALVWKSEALAYSRDIPEPPGW
jgi:hypothetical protein